MGDIQLGNEKHVLGACRAYKRACRVLRHAIEDDRNGAILLADAGVSATKESDKLAAAKSAVTDCRERLLYLIETGEKSYPKAKKGNGNAVQD